MLRLATLSLLGLSVHGAASFAELSSTSMDEDFSVQDQMRKLAEELAKDEMAVKKLAHAECTYDVEEEVKVSGADIIANDHQGEVCSDLGELKGCHLDSKSAKLVKKLNEIYAEKCECAIKNRKIVEVQEGIIDKNNQDLEAVKKEAEKQAREFEEIHKEFIASGALENMQKAIDLLQKIHDDVEGKFSLIQEASKTLSKCPNGGESLSTLLELAANKYYKASNSDVEHESNLNNHENKLQDIINDLIKYIKAAMTDIEEEIAAEEQQAKDAATFYASENRRITKANTVAEEKIGEATEAGAVCVGASSDAKSEHEKVVDNAKASHSSFQHYMRDINKEKAALQKIFEILTGGHENTAAAVATANEHHGQVTHLYDTNMGFKYSEVGEMFEGWNTQEVYKVTDNKQVKHFVHGPFSGRTQLKKTFDVPADAKLTISFRYWALDSWDHEWGYLYVDGKEVWKKQRTNYHNCNGGNWKNNNGAQLGYRVPDPWGGSNNQACYEDVEITIDHSGATAEFNFKSNINQGERDEAFAVEMLTIESEAVVAPSLGKLEGFSYSEVGKMFEGWNTQEVYKVKDNKQVEHFVHGPFSGRTHLRKTIEVPEDTVEISFRYWALDSWDHEWGYFKVNDKLVWRKQRTNYHNCNGGSWKNNNQAQLGYRVPDPWGGKNNQACYEDVTVTVSGLNGKAALHFYSNINQGENDEAYAVENLEIRTPKKGASLVKETSSFSGWNHQQMYKATDSSGVVHAVHGPFAGKHKLEKQFTFPANSELRISFRYWALDSWDHEWGYFKINNELVWRKQRTNYHNCNGGNWKNNNAKQLGYRVPDPWGGSNNQACYEDVSVTFKLKGTNAKFSFSSNINQQKNDEAYAVELLTVEQL